MDGLAGLMDLGFGSTDEKWEIEIKGWALEFVGHLIQIHEIK